MKITKQSVYTGVTRTLDLPITSDEIARWENGEMIQAVWPNLTDNERLFLLDGATQEEWDAIFPPEDAE